MAARRRVLAPLFFIWPGVSRIREAAGPLGNRGRTGRQGPGALKSTQCAQTSMLGPADLDASRHRGLSKSVIAASPPVPRRPARDVFRFAPRRPRRADNFYPPLVTPCRGAGSSAAWTAGPRRCISSEASFPATAPRPASEDADQTPLVWGGMGI